LKAGWTDWAEGIAWGYKVFWARDLIAELNELTARADVQPVWLTSWEGAAATHLSAVIGLNGADWPVLTLGSFVTGWPKLDALRSDLAEQETAGNRIDQVIWLDDDIRRHRTASNWAKTAPIPTRLISPQRGVGITRKHIETVRALLS
jgi:hypothetical protein